MRSRLAMVASIALLIGCSDSEESATGSGGGSQTAGTGASSSGEGATGSGASSGTGASGGSGAASTGGGGSGPVLETLHLSGRFDTSDAAGPRSAWSGSSVGVRFSGTSIDVQLDGAANYFEVIVDGAPTMVLATDGGAGTYPLAVDLPDAEHDVELYRRAEAFQGVTQFVAFQPGGAGKLVDSPSPYLHKIEFIGDSITCGYGDEEMAPCNFSTATESSYITYAAIAARSTKADAHVIAWSGKGMAKNCCGDGSELMPVLYERTFPQDGGSQWDFSSWIADAVVVNLGTNDWNSGVDPTAYEDAYKAFLQELRAHYPAAMIYCVGGAFLGDTPTMHIQSLIAALGDAKVKLLDFPGPDPADGFGCDGHPSAATHAKLGAVLTGVLQADLGW